MNFSTLEKAWHNQTVTGGGEPAEAIAARMKREVAIARRRIRGGIVVAAFLLFTEWAGAIVPHLISLKLLTPVALIAHAVNSLLLVIFLVRAFRSARAVRSEMELMGGTLRESVEATLRTVELQIENARIAAYAIPAVVAIAAWLLTAKYLAGDIPGFGAAVGSAFMALIGAVIGAGVWHRHRKHLAPQREELKETLQTLGSET